MFEERIHDIINGDVHIVQKVPLSVDQLLQDMKAFGYSLLLDFFQVCIGR